MYAYIRCRSPERRRQYILVLLRHQKFEKSFGNPMSTQFLDLDKIQKQDAIIDILV